jgi:hypothetical protein
VTEIPTLSTYRLIRMSSHPRLSKPIGIRGS